jgi:hypothetical protein
MRTVLLSVSALASSAFLLSTLTSLSACVLPNTTSDAGTSIPTPNGDAALTATASGTGCGTDPTTGVTLCTGTSVCPSVVVDESVFPECGFYVSDGNVYLACLCSNYLCPIGQPATCQEAADLLQASTEGMACGEASNGGCTEVMTTSPPVDAGMTGTGSTDAGSGPCDDACAAMCDGVGPSCLEMCGC